jgi:hypothetical protein
LDQVSAISLGFPHDLFNVPLGRTLAFGGMRDRIKV